jgi:hypothetical protein
MGPEEVQYDQAMARGLTDITIVIQGFAGSPLEQEAQKIVDLWIDTGSPKSVKAAIESDKTLGGIVQQVQVMRTTGYRIYNLPDRSETLGCEFFVRVFNTGD